MEISEADLKEIKNDLKAISENVQMLLTAQAVQEPERQMIKDHEEILKGKKKEPGLVSMVDRHDDWIRGANRALWAIALSFIGGVVTAILFILRMVPVK